MKEPDGGEDMPQKLRSSIASLFDENRITVRTFEGVGINKNVVSDLRKDDDSLPNGVKLRKVLKAGVTQGMIGEDEAEALLVRHGKLSATSNDVRLVPAEVVVPREADPDDHARAVERPGARSTPLWVPLVVLVGAAVLVALLIVVIRHEPAPASSPMAMITVRNQLAIGPSGLTADPAGPAYLSTKDAPSCARAVPSCKVPDSDLAPGEQLPADCEKHDGAEI
ncbi:hypothetical protein [Amycolatopsis sp. NPDC051371]|uniref:hypothetical protein n=1 Tax=Amycolatopsis sp. NPDC051371 TaxID=3155800 RepID=UPI00343DD562